MEFNNKKLEKTSRLVNYLIAIVLCGFLIALSGKLIDDVDEWKERPRVEDFQNTQLLDQENLQVDKINDSIGLKRQKLESIQNTIKVTNNNYRNAKKSFDNWLEARKTVGSPQEDKEVLNRANQLDEYYKTEQQWRNELEQIKREISLLNTQKSERYFVIDTEKTRAYKEREVAIRKYDLKVFLIRLMFILPILVLGIFFIIKFRKHKYWPLFLGFVLFSFYSFFFGLVPYLPSYGGYIRYAIGIALVVFLGGYAINGIKAFIERKKSELKVSTSERAKKVQTETAEKALDNHMCPSCGKDFIIKRWDKFPVDKKKAEGFGLVTNFCRYCGLELFKKCGNCGTENFAHLPYCTNCGTNISEKEKSNV